MLRHFLQPSSYSSCKLNCTRREETSGASTDNGFRIVSALDKTASQIGGEVAKLTATLGSIQRDVGNLQQELVSIKYEGKKARASTHDPAVLSGLENRLTSMISTVSELAQQLETPGSTRAYLDWSQKTTNRGKISRI